MDEHAKDLREFLSDPAFHGGLHVVNSRKRKIIAHGAMQRKVQASSDSLENQIVSVDYLREPLRYALNPTLITRRLHHAIGGFDGRRLAFNMGEYGGDLGDFHLHLTFQHRHTVVSLAKRHVFV